MTDTSATMSATAPRPNIWVSKIQFANGQTFSFSRDDITVIVGPNNCGKSQTLKDLHHLLEGAQNNLPLVLKIELESLGSDEDFATWVEARTNKAGNFSFPTFGQMPPHVLHNAWAERSHGYISQLRTIVEKYLQTEDRLMLVRPATAHSLDEQATMPLQAIFDDDDMQIKISKVFERAFGQNLVVHPRASKSITMHVGKRPTPPPGKDRLSAEYQRAVGALPRIETQGDGYRAFTGILMNILVSNFDMFLIDEPEVFLHPPQAVMMGKLLAKETPANKQLFISTHSSDIVRGLLDQAASRIRVLRITRNGDKSEIKELNAENIKKVWNNPLLRYSKILDGLFHDGVVICEGDADCRFYAAMTDAVSEDIATPDLAFVYGAGLSRLPTIINALKPLGVPVRVVTDFDILREDDGLKSIFESLGGDWSSIREPVQKIQKAINAKKPEIPKSDALKEIEKVFAAESGTSLTDKMIRAVKATLKKASAWSEAKRSGKTFIPSGEATTAYFKLVADLKAVGLYVLDVGELESFCKSIGGHGPDWVVQVLEKDLLQDSELQSARDFASELLAGWSATGSTPNSASA